jgi:hypothetical protein
MEHIRAIIWAAECPANSELIRHRYEYFWEDGEN